MNERSIPMLQLDRAEIEKICRPYFGSSGSLQEFRPLSGGAVNTTYQIVWNNQNYVLRFYIRDPQFALVEEEVYHLVQKKIPVPSLLFSGIDQKSGPFALFEFMNKKHIFEFLDRSLDSSISYSLGKTLATIHSFTFPQAGLFRKGFEVHTPFEEGISPYYSYCMKYLVPDSLAWERLGHSCAVSLKNFLEKNQTYFPLIENGGVLVHSDFKPVNLLWSESEGLTVLDWEFAHIGQGLFDFAILLRHANNFPLNIESLQRGYLDNGGELPEEWSYKAHLLDVTNIVQLLNTPAPRPKLFQFLKDSIDLTLKSRE